MQHIFPCSIDNETHIVCSELCPITVTWKTVCHTLNIQFKVNSSGINYIYSFVLLYHFEILVYASIDVLCCSTLFYIYVCVATEFIYKAYDDVN